MKKLSILTLTAIIMASCGIGVESEPTELKPLDQSVESSESANEPLVPGGDINFDQFNILLEQGSIKLVDVRTEEEFAEGVIPDAVNIDVLEPDFKEKISSLDKSAPVILYCQSGRRSANAMAIMNKMGFETVYNLIGGYSMYELQKKDKE